MHNGRVVAVLMDTRHFSEVNLRELFTLLSKRFPKPDELHVAVFSSLDQVPTPEEEDRSTSTDELPYEKQIGKYPNASYMRLKGNEEFQYSLGEGQAEQRVIIRRTKP